MKMRGSFHDLGFRAMVIREAVRGSGQVIFVHEPTLEPHEAEYDGKGLIRCGADVLRGIKKSAADRGEDISRAEAIARAAMQ